MAAGDRKWRTARGAEVGSGVSPVRTRPGVRRSVNEQEGTASADRRTAMLRGTISSLEQMNLESRKTGSEPAKLGFSCFPDSLSGPCFHQSKRDSAPAVSSATSNRTRGRRLAKQKGRWPRRDHRPFIRATGFRPGRPLSCATWRRTSRCRGSAAARTGSAPPGPRRHRTDRRTAGARSPDAPR